VRWLRSAATASGAGHGSRKRGGEAACSSRALGSGDDLFYSGIVPAPPLRSETHTTHKHVHQAKEGALREREEGVRTNCRCAGTSSAGRTPGGRTTGRGALTRFLGRDYDITIGDGPHTDVVVHARTDDKGTKLALCRCNDTYGPTCQFFLIPSFPFATQYALREDFRQTFSGTFPGPQCGQRSVNGWG
jgi:hypothetical protein